MTWQLIREQYPHSWVLVEATEAHTAFNERIADDLVVIETFQQNWQAAWERYIQLHQVDRRREYYVVHTDRPELNIGVLDAFGRMHHNNVDDYYQSSFAFCDSYLIG